MKIDKPEGAPQTAAKGPTKAFGEALRQARGKSRAAAASAGQKAPPKPAAPPGKTSRKTVPLPPPVRQQASGAAFPLGKLQEQASRDFEERLEQCHAASGKVARGRHEDREDHGIKARLFQELEREEAKKAEPIEAARKPESASVDRTCAAEGSRDRGASPAGRAAAIEALVERVQASIKAGHPTLTLGLSDRTGVAQVEISRTGRGEVAVKLSAKPGKRQTLAQSAREIREALASRGLKIASLRIT